MRKSAFFRQTLSAILAILPALRINWLKVFVWKISGVHVTYSSKISSSFKVIGAGDVEIGANTFIGHNVVFYNSGTAITVGKNVDIAPEVMLVTGSHKIGTSNRRAGEGRNTSILIGNGCWLGARTVILGGSKIGDGTVVAAGSVVSGELEPMSLYAGAPCRKVKSLDE